jgi:lipoate-protein ligase A
MIVRLDYKVPGGKLLRVEVEAEGGTVLCAAVRGDFFAHPEASFEAAEAELSGVPAKRLRETALAAFARPGLTIFGAAPADIAEALGRAVDGMEAR